MVFDLFSSRQPSPEQPTLPKPAPGITLEYAQREMASALREGTTCPCCGQHAQLYKRKLNSGMARALIFIYLRNRMRAGYFHVLKELTFEKSGGDYGKLVHWGLIEQMQGDTDDGNPESGLYRITPLGERFALMQAKVPKWTYHYNQICLGTGGGLITIRQALRDKFNYSELMGA